MDTYFANQPVSITFVPSDSAGVLITDASDVSYRVLDGEGVEYVAITPLPSATAQPTIEVVIDAEANGLVSGILRGFRRVELSFTSGGRTYQSIEEYIIEAVDTLQVLTNSFQSYADAMMQMSELTGLDTLEAAERRERIRGLINAFNVIVRLRFSLASSFGSYNDYLMVAPDWASGRTLDVRTLTLDQFQALPVDFLSALKTAQVIEADEALNQFSVLKKRQQGLMSETIGESSMMFRPEKVLNLPMTRRGLEYLRPYLVWNLGVGRG